LLSKALFGSIYKAVTQRYAEDHGVSRRKTKNNYQAFPGLTTEPEAPFAVKKTGSFGFPGV
jgi:hypothetical protein